MDKITMKAARVNKGLTQENVAKIMNVSRNTVYMWEKGKVKPKPAQFQMYCRICGRDPEKIFYPNN